VREAIPELPTYRPFSHRSIPKLLRPHIESAAYQMIQQAIQHRFLCVVGENTIKLAGAASVSEFQQKAKKNTFRQRKAV